jgi:hypothetical protein
MLAMELLLLPFNVWRLAEILRKKRKIATRGARDVGMTEMLGKLGRARNYSKGSRIFSRGDAPTHLYVIDTGTIVLPELGITLGPGEVFGELAFFTDAQARTVSATCLEPCRIHAVDEKAFMDLYFLNPAFAMAMIRLITRRLIDGVAQNPDIYRTVLGRHDASL